VAKEKEEKQKVIELMDGYVCIVDRLSWALAREKGIRKDGKVDYKYYGYFNGFSGVLRQLGRELSYDALPDGSTSLVGAIRYISESNNRLIEFINEKFPDYEVVRKE